MDPLTFSSLPQVEDARRVMEMRDRICDPPDGAKPTTPKMRRDADRLLAAAARDAARALSRAGGAQEAINAWLDVGRVAGRAAAAVEGQCLPCEGMGQLCRRCEAIPCLCPRGPFEGLGVCLACGGTGMEPRARD